jgi:hypothetical protein
MTLNQDEFSPECDFDVSRTTPFARTGGTFELVVTLINPFVSARGSGNAHTFSVINNLELLPKEFFHVTSDFYVSRFRYRNGTGYSRVYPSFRDQRETYFLGIGSTIFGSKSPKLVDLPFPSSRGNILGLLGGDVCYYSWLFSSILAPSQ